MRNVTATFDGYDIRVPAPDKREASAYYTDDKDDARGNANRMWGEEVNLKFRKVLEHPGTNK